MQALAEAEKAPTVEFKLCKAMPYPTRVALILVGLVVGLLLQLFMTWYIGLPFIFVAGLFSLYASTTNEPDTGYFGQWENVTLDELAKVQETLERTAEWKRKDPMSVATPFGCFLFFVLLGVVALIAGYLLYAVGNDACYAIAADGFLLLVFIFGSGTRNAWEPPGLAIKLAPLLNVCRHLENFPDPNIEVTPMLELQGKGEKKVPRDCKMMLKFKNAPEEFLGVQVQTSVNSVQGTEYPYMYCVLLAKPGSGLTERVAPFLTPATEELGWFANANDKKNPDRRKLRYRSEVAEPKTQEDVDLVVIRQVTLGQGYHTEKDAQLRVVRMAIDLAKRTYDL